MLPAADRGAAAPHAIGRRAPAVHPQEARGRNPTPRRLPPTRASRAWRSRLGVICSSSWGYWGGRGMSDQGVIALDSARWGAILRLDDAIEASGAVADASVVPAALRRRMPELALAVVRCGWTLLEE